jgi:hypothetical protein
VQATTTTALNPDGISYDKTVALRQDVVRRTTKKPRWVPGLVFDYQSSVLGKLLRQRRLLFGNDFTLGGHFSVQCNVGLPFVRHVVFVKNGLNGAFWNAGFTVNTLVWLDVQHPLAFVKALNGTDHYTIGVTAAIAGFSYNVSHLD